MSGQRRRTVKPVGVIPALPASVDTECFVLGSILLDDRAFASDAAASLLPEDFSLESHRRIFQRMCGLYIREERIDHVTVADELMRNGELESVGGLNYLVSLDEGLPHLPNIESYIAIIKEKSQLRRLQAISQNLSLRVELGEKPAEIIAAAQRLLAGFVPAGNTIRIVDIPGVRTCGASEIKYILEPELPKGSVVGLTGDSGSGKSTLATAWARDVDVPVLFLDRENPLSVVVKRLNNLGFADCSRLRYWGGWLEMELMAQRQEIINLTKAEPPQPDDPAVLDWVRACDPKPLVVVDSLVAFHGGDENSAGEMRTFMQRCRRLANLGATVVVIHHQGKGDSSKDFRGSTDFKASLDLGFHVSNFGPTGLLDKLSLRTWKSRIPCPGEIGYDYASGRFVRREDAEVRETVTEQLQAILRLNPGITGSKFEDLAVSRSLARNRARLYLADGTRSGAIRWKPGPRNARYFHLAADGESGGQFTL